MAEQKGQMTVAQAGKKGGQKGGETTRKRYGREFYQKIGREGGEKVRKLVRAGKEQEEK